uniref:Uncharacterized protein n=1 Tax=Candidatus Kentrum sp. FM TaxID=2126340 RepID=A0A450X6D5_9GAMM|nr:MAG: hypothetical protein BECKFM1743C_GA0114222_109802 [Candidatus Kentron sp. FM]VFK24780.1 MAG: hypothetical protein BECKFM1743B_GA0114221_110172 [Candidatus Kentron sp. FM]
MRGKPDRSFGELAGTMGKQNPIFGKLAGILGRLYRIMGKPSKGFEWSAEGLGNFPKAWAGFPGPWEGLPGIRQGLPGCSGGVLIVWEGLPEIGGSQPKRSESAPEAPEYRISIRERLLPKSCNQDEFM